MRRFITNDGNAKKASAYACGTLKPFKSILAIRQQRSADADIFPIRFFDQHDKSRFRHVHDRRSGSRQFGRQGLLLLFAQSACFNSNNGHISEPPLLHGSAKVPNSARERRMPRLFLGFALPRSDSRRTPHKAQGSGFRSDCLSLAKA